MKVYLVLLCLFCGSCSDTPFRLYFRDVELTPAYTQHLDLALAALNGYAGQEFIGFSGNRPISIRMVDSSKLNNTDSTLAHARYLEYHCLIELRSDLESVIRMQYNSASPSSVSTNEVKEGVAMVIMHEIGHCYGLPHSTNSVDIMYDDFNPNWNANSLESFSKEILRLSRK